METPFFIHCKYKVSEDSKSAMYGTCWYRYVLEPQASVSKVKKLDRCIFTNNTGKGICLHLDTILLHFENISTALGSVLYSIVLLNNG